MFEISFPRLNKRIDEIANVAEIIEDEPNDQQPFLQQEKSAAADQNGEVVEDGERNDRGPVIIKRSGRIDDPVFTRGDEKSIGRGNERTGRTCSHLRSSDSSTTARISPRTSPFVEFRFVAVDSVGSIGENAEEK